MTRMLVALRPFWRSGAAALLALSFVAGCKGETKTRDNPQTVQKLSACEESLQQKEAYIKTLEARVTELESGEGTAVVVNIEGEAMEITAGADKGPHVRVKDPRGDAKDAELYASFVKSLERSRGSIQKCYQSALKKNTALQARTVTLNIAVDYRTSGKVSDASFSPRISDQFNACMRTVADKWTLPAMPRAVSFNYKQTLTPE